MPWINQLGTQILQEFPLAHGLEPIPDNELLQPPWLLSTQDDTNKKLLVPRRDGSAKAKSDKGLEASVNDGLRQSGLDLEVLLEENKRLTPKTHWQDVRQLTFLTQVHVDYLPGDIITVYPQNDPEDVDRLIKLLGWDYVADNPVDFYRNTECHIQPSTAIPSLGEHMDSEGMTLKLYLRKHADINAIPRRSFFSMLAHFTTDDFQRSRLREFTDPQYLDELYDYTTRPRRSILEVLQEFDTVKLPWQWAAAILPRLRGRQFSIASGGHLKNANGRSTRFELLVAIVRYRTVIRKLRRGVCTKYLEELRPGSSIHVLLQKGGLGITQDDLAKPILMVGPGTGVAPIRSLIWQRMAWADEAKVKQNTGSSACVSTTSGANFLFFGCRNKDADYFFEAEWNELKKDIPLDVFTAFSRDQGEKHYVQDLICSNSRLVHETLFQQKGILVVCGSSGKMPQAVRESLISVIQKEGSLSQAFAQAYVVSMEKDGRYKQETW